MRTNRWRVIHEAYNFYFHGQLEDGLINPHEYVQILIDFEENLPSLWNAFNNSKIINNQIRILLSKEVFSKIRGSTISELKRQVNNYFSKFFNLSFNIINLFEGIRLFSNQQTINFSFDFQNLISAGQQHISLTNFKFPLPDSIKPVPFSENLSQILSLTYEKANNNLELFQNKAQIVYQHGHVCQMCKIRPAVYLSSPCNHPILCSKCCQQLQQEKALFPACFICGTPLKKLRGLAFLETK